MRFRLLLAFLTLVIAIPIFAQDEEEEPLPPRHHAQPKIGGAGGFTQNLLFLNLDPINALLRGSKSAEFTKEPILMLGGQGYGYIIVVPNLRIGGSGAGGSLMSKALDEATNTTRTVQLSAGYGGVNIDYVVPVVPRLDLTAGVFLGGGGISVKMTRDQGNGKAWDNLWRNFGSNDSTYEYTRNLSGSFFIVQPSINVEVAVLRWLGLRVGAAYMGMVGGSWKMDDNFDLVGVPDNINGRGFMLNGGIFLGTFLF